MLAWIGACDNPQAGTPGIDPPSAEPHHGGPDAGYEPGQPTKKPGSGTGGSAAQREDSGHGGAGLSGSTAAGNTGGSGLANGSGGSSTQNPGADAGTAKATDGGMTNPLEEVDAGL